MRVLTLFLKTHNIYGAYKGKNFTTQDFSLGAIYIVRDPRNVLTSLMNHYSLNEDDDWGTGAHGHTIRVSI